MGEKKDKKKEQELKEWKNRIHDYRKEASSQFNKQIVYLSSGGLILTVGFVKDIVEIKTASCCCFLILSWMLLAGSLLLNLISHRSTMKAMDLELNDKCDESDKQDSITVQYDNASVITLISGIGLFVIFVSINIF
jgi:hypothetical protein